MATVLAFGALPRPQEFALSGAERGEVKGALGR